MQLFCHYFPAVSPEDILLYNKILHEIFLLLEAMREKSK